MNKENMQEQPIFDVKPEDTKPEDSKVQSEPLVEKPKKVKKEPDFFGTTKKADPAALQKQFERFRKSKQNDIKYRNYVA